MKVLYPGLMVKVVALDEYTPAEWLGREGMIVEIHDDGNLDYPVLYGLNTCPLFYDGEWTYGLDETQIEPVLPDGLMENIEEEELVYV